MRFFFPLIISTLVEFHVFFAQQYLILRSAEQHSKLHTNIAKQKPLSCLSQISVETTFRTYWSFKSKDQRELQITDTRFYFSILRSSTIFICVSLLLLIQREMFLSYRKLYLHSIRKSILVTATGVVSNLKAAQSCSFWYNSVQY